MKKKRNLYGINATGSRNSTTCEGSLIHKIDYAREICGMERSVYRRGSISALSLSSFKIDSIRFHKRVGFSKNVSSRGSRLWIADTARIVFLLLNYIRFNQSIKKKKKGKKRGERDYTMKNPSDWLDKISCLDMDKPNFLVDRINFWWMQQKIKFL